MHRMPANDLVIASFNSRVFGVDLNTGEPRWEAELGTGGDVAVRVVGDVVVAAMSDLVAIIAYATGAVLATVKLPTVHGGEPRMTISGDRVIVAGNGEVSCVSLRGQLLWSQPFKGKGVGEVRLATPAG